MKFILTAFLLFLFKLSDAQFSIQGKVVDSATGEPLESISIFLSNTTKGTITDSKGMFLLEHLTAGKYELVVSSVGYKDYVVLVQVNGSAEPVMVRLTPKASLLKEVIVESYDKNGWRKWGDNFKSILIGSASLAKNCILKNPEVVKFSYNSKSNRLIAFSNEKLIIENTDLGYRIMYLLSKFEIDFNSNTFSFGGYPLFEELKPKKINDNARWNQMRMDTYKGSLRHFIRSLYFNQLSKDGFEIRKEKFISAEESYRVKNMLEQVQAKEDGAGTGNSNAGKDSMIYYLKIKNLALGERWLVSDSILPGDTIVTDSGDQNSKLVYFSDYLQVLYLKKKIPNEYAKTLPQDRRNEFTISDINLKLNTPIFIYPNGNYYSGLNLLVDGYWAWSEKIATMLPGEYNLDK